MVRRSSPARIRARSIHTMREDAGYRKAARTRKRKASAHRAARKTTRRTPCKVHKGCLTIGKKKFQVLANCKGKVVLTKTGRKKFATERTKCRCKKNTRMGAKQVGKTCRRKTYRRK